MSIVLNSVALKHCTVSHLRNLLRSIVTFNSTQHDKRLLRRHSRELPHILSILVGSPRQDLNSLLSTMKCREQKHIYL